MFQNLIHLSISRRKFFASLGKSRVRKDEGLFMVEGEKALLEMIDSQFLSLRYVVATEAWWSLQSDDNIRIDEGYIVTDKDMAQISNLVTHPDVIGIFEMPQTDASFLEIADDTLVLALDGIQDPGNMGTIIRLADWWGVRLIVCSAETVDCYNPKVVQSAMGALGRVRILRTRSLFPFIREHIGIDVPVYGTFLDGENIFSSQLSSHGVIVMGNEGNGISREAETNIDCRLTIPSYPGNGRCVESLNVGTATAIVLAEFRRRTLDN